MAALDALIVELEAKTDQFNAQFGAASKAIADFEKSSALADKATRLLQNGLESTKSPLDALIGSFAAAAVKFNIFTRALNHVENIAKEAFSVMEEAARTNTAEKYFNDAGKSVEAFRKATGGLISDADIIKKINLGDSLGLTGKQMEQLAAIAQAASAKTGQSFTYMFDSIITGEARASKKILDNLGVIFDEQQAYRDYAKVLQEAGVGAGKSLDFIAKHLDDTAKRQAVFNATIAASKGPLEQFGKLGGDDASKFDKFKASVDNLKLAIGSMLDDVFGGSAVGKLTAFVDKLQDMVRNFQALLQYGTAWEMVKATVSGAASGEFSALKGISPGDLANPVLLIDKLVGGSLKGAAGGLSDLGAEKHAKALNDLYAERQTQEALLYREGVDVNKVIGGTGDEMKKLNDWTRPAVEKLRALNDQIIKMGGVGIVNTNGEASALGGITGGGGGRGRAAPKDTYVPYNVFESMGHVDPNKFLDQVNAFAASLDSADIKRAMERIKQGTASFEDFATMMELAPDKWKDYVQRLSDKTVSALDQAAMVSEQLQRKAEEILKQTIDDYARAGQTFLSGAFQGGSGGADLGIKGIGMAIGAFFGDPQLGGQIAEAIAPLLDKLKPVIDLFDSLSRGLMKFAQIGLAPLLNMLEPLGPALEIFLAALGQVVQSALKPLEPILFLLAQAISYVIVGIADALLVLSPVVEAFVDIFLFGIGIVEGFFKMLLNFTGIHIDMSAASDAFARFANIMIDGAVSFVNALTGLIRMIPGLEDFGTILNFKDFEVSLTDNTAATDTNTGASKANTAAINNLAREFRNLPSGYKVNYPIYESTTPVGMPHQPIRPDLIGAFGNFRQRL